MATRLFRNARRLVTYWPSLQTVSKPARAFSSDSILGPEDHRLPLPGNVGLGKELFKNLSERAQPKGEPDVLTKELPSERYADVMHQAQKTEMDWFAETEDFDKDSLECVVQECPALIRKDFADLFTGRDINTGPFTVITLCQKTKNDMSFWSEDVDKEREEMMYHFMILAEEICKKLIAAGFWADFIDPSSGRPYLGSYTNSTLFETDERYRNFGFKIEDLGCCKVIEHKKWGTHAFVGSVFTNAPLDSDFFKEILMSFSAECEQ